VHVGDTITLASRPPPRPCPAIAAAADGLFRLLPGPATQFPELRDSLEKLRLNDAALTFQPISSDALGFGFRCGFLGLLHMEIVQERLEREHGVELFRRPRRSLQVLLRGGQILEVDSAGDLPDAGKIEESASRTSGGLIVRPIPSAASCSFRRTAERRTSRPSTSPPTA